MVEGIADSIDVNLGKLWEMVRDKEVWHAAVHGFTKSQTWLGDWTTTLLQNNYKNQGRNPEGMTVIKELEKWKGIKEN